MSHNRPLQEDCTTGVINELGGCEPVGVIPPDLQDDFYPPPAPPTTTIVAVGEPPIPPTLPATGTESVALLVGAVAAIIIGGTLSRITHKETP